MRIHFIWAAFLAACTTGGGGGGGGGGGTGGAGDIDAAAEVMCADDADRRADIDGPFECDGPPEFVTLVIEETGRDFDIFTYEASHPLATATEAFPCTGLRGEDGTNTPYEAPLGDTVACSKAGVRPWHTVRWEDADAACKAVPVEDGGREWRLCEDEEWLRACRGPAPGTAFAGGGDLGTPRRCNIQDAYVPDGATFATEAPTGEFENCVTADGVYDLTGNVAEWTNKRDDRNARNRYRRGGGWSFQAEFHDETGWQCLESELPAIGQFAPTYKRTTLGFRCCRLHVD